MKMTLLIRIIFMIFAGFVFAYEEGYGADWKYCCSTDKELHLYDATSVIRPSKDVVKVWSKRVAKEKRLSSEEWVGVLLEFTKKMRDIPESERKFTYNYMVNTLYVYETTILFEIKCTDRMLRILAGAKYDKEHKFIDSIESSDWDHIQPETIAESLYVIVCSQR